MTTKQRLAIERREMPEQDADRRRSNQCEVPLGFDALDAMIEAARCLECKDAPCVQSCPVGLDIPGFISLLRDGDFAGAARRIRETNCLPAITGRVCPQEEQCQLKCKVGKIRKDVCESVSIGRLERFVADWERSANLEDEPARVPSSGRRVAIVGSGPAGLACAGDLVRSGHEVVVFESFHRVGGVLVYGIPEFRLPKDIVDWEVSKLEKLGVRFEVNVVVGRTITIEELLIEEGFDAVFLGTGAGLPLFLDLPGESSVGVYAANEYLTRANLMQAYRFPETDTPVIRGRNVAVFGGGNVAMDAARTALRLGAERVSLVYRRTVAEMPARLEERRHAQEEGVEFLELRAPTEFLADERGYVRAARLQVMELGEADGSGRRKPSPIPGKEEIIDVDLVILAIGNGPAPLVPETTPELEVSRHGTIVAEERTGRTSMRGVFAGGDIVSGAATVILAMGQGRAAAAAIDDYLATGHWLEDASDSAGHA